MPRYEFTAQAERDLEAIIDYTLVRWGSRQAEDYLNGLGKLAQNLAENSDLGMRRDELIEGLISFPYGSHNLFYAYHLSLCSNSTSYRHGLPVSRTQGCGLSPAILGFWIPAIPAGMTY
jgi:toxin ParE1/3/4